MADGAEIPPPPPGFKLTERRAAGSSNHNGPFFDGPKGDGCRRAFYSLPRHANGMGLVHGGMLTAFMDALLAGAIHDAIDRTGVTIHLSIDFLHMARVGEWVIGEAKLTRATRDLAFVEGRLNVGEREVARATGIFKLMHRKD